MAPQRYSRFIAMITAAILTVAPIPIALAGPASTPDGSTTGTEIDLTDPAASIADPLEDIPPLDRNCLDEQVDINTADLAEIMQALGISSKPTGQRILDQRPFLRAIDAVSVPGVGPARMGRLSTALCATPTELPPLVSMAPSTGFQGVDLQAANGQEIAALGILNAQTSQRLADYGPLPQDLSTIATPAVPGLSIPLIKRLERSDAVAITPAPFTYEGTTWRWITRDHGAVVRVSEDERHALYVPPQTVVDDGAWARIAALPMDDSSLPANDAHIHGDWNHEVGVQLPAAAGATAENTLILHEAGDEWRISMFEGVAEGEQGTVVSAATSLSVHTSAIRPELDQGTGGLENCGSPYQTASIWCESTLLKQGLQTRDAPLQELSESLRLKMAELPVTTPGPCDGISNPLILVSGSMWQMSCTLESNPPGSVTFDWENRSAGPFNFGNVYEYSAFGSAHAEVIHSMDKGLFTTEVLNGLAASRGDILPGDTLNVTILQGSGPGSTSVKTARNPEYYFGLANLLGAVDSASAVLDGWVFHGFQTRWLDCLNSFGGDDAVVACGFTALEQALDVARATTPPGVALARIDSTLMIVRRLAPALLVVDVATTPIIWLREVEPRTATYEYERPRPFPPGPSQSPMGGGYVAVIDGQGFFVDIAQNVALEIETPSSWNCYATGYYGFMGKFTLAPDGPRLTTPGNPEVVAGQWAPPCDTLPRTWDYTSVRIGGNIPDGVLIRQPDWDGIRWSGYVNGEGQIQWDTNGAATSCLSEVGTPVVLNFPDIMIDAWNEELGEGENLNECPR